MCMLEVMAQSMFNAMGAQSLLTYSLFANMAQSLFDLMEAQSLLVYITIH